MIQLSQVEMVGLALGAITVLAFIWAINANLRSDRENQVRDLATEHQARGGWVGYVRDRQGRLKASRTSRSVPIQAAISDPDPVRRARRWIRNDFWPRAGRP
jgi:hypothetical protein